MSATDIEQMFRKGALDYRLSVGEWPGWVLVHPCSFAQLAWFARHLARARGLPRAARVEFVGIPIFMSTFVDPRQAMFFAGEPPTDPLEGEPKS